VDVSPRKTGTSNLGDLIHSAYPGRARKARVAGVGKGESFIEGARYNETAGDLDYVVEVIAI
jgi:hypothetical protein